MKRINIVWGLLLIAVGAVFLLQNLGLIANGLNVLWAVLFGAVGLTFLWTYLADRQRWWALIPAGVLLTLCVTVIMGFTIADQMSGTVFLVGLGLTFLAVYLVRRDHWWPLIPSGVLLSLAATSYGGEREMNTGGLFFFGLGLTFLLLFVLARLRWALIPAVVLAVIGVFMWFGQTMLLQYLNYIWPALLIIGGLYLLYKAARR